jgi:hypothetical protein
MGDEPIQKQQFLLLTESQSKKSMIFAIDVKSIQKRQLLLSLS